MPKIKGYGIINIVFRKNGVPIKRKKGHADELDIIIMEEDLAKNGVSKMKLLLHVMDSCMIMSYKKYVGPDKVFPGETVYIEL